MTPDHGINLYTRLGQIEARLVSILEQTTKTNGYVREHSETIAKIGQWIDSHEQTQRANDKTFSLLSDRVWNHQKHFDQQRGGWRLISMLFGMATAIAGFAASYALPRLIGR